MDNAAVSDVMAGKTCLRLGSRGAAVRIIQQGLIDLNKLYARHVNGVFDERTERAVLELQRQWGLTPNGVVDQTTMQKIDELFRSMRPYVVLAQRAATTAGTRDLTSVDLASIDRALQPPNALAPQPGGQAPRFQEEVDGQRYGPALERRINAVIDRQFENMAKGKADAHRDPSQLHDWKSMEDVGAQSKKATDAVFGNWKQGPEIKAGTVLFDRWAAETKRQKAASPKQLRGTAEWRVEKILRSDAKVQALNTKHNADRTKAPVKGIVADIAKRIVDRRQGQLLEIHKGWPGAASDGKVYLQRFKSADAQKNRRTMWRLFQTIIHEYLHTLTHPKYFAYARSLSKDKGHTLREGMTDLFTKIVYSNVSLTPQLRKSVEGCFYDKDNPFAVPPLHTYGATQQAEQVMAVAGARAMYNAFFLGKVDLVGAKKNR